MEHDAPPATMPAVSGNFMEIPTDSIKGKLGRYAIILRKYNLGDRNTLFSEFPKIDKLVLEDAWLFGFKKIQNKEIIKDVTSLDPYGTQLVDDRLSYIGYSSDWIYDRLNALFNVKNLKLFDENVERRFRRLLAEKYLRLASSEIRELHEKGPQAAGVNTRKKIGKVKYGLIIVSIVGILFTPRIIDGLTPADRLAEKIHQRSKYTYRIGATCRDGWQSKATGSGACSHHGGVKEWNYATGYKKTMEECLNQAKKRSWRN